MKSQETLKFKNRHLMLQTNDQKSQNLQNGPQLSNLSILSESHQICSPSIRSQSLPKSNKYWSQAQQQLFAQFWLEKFIQNPCENYSLDSPFARKCYNKQASDYIKQKAKKLSIICQKSEQQCKTKIGTIRRKMHRERKRNNSKQSQKEFIDIIFQKAESLRPLTSQLEEKIKKVRDLREQEGPFLKIVIEDYKQIKSKSFVGTYNILLNYLEKSRGGTDPKIDK